MQRAATANRKRSIGAASIEVAGIKYFSVVSVARAVGVSRQTVWRWRLARKIPSGHLYRNHQTVFTAEEFEAVREFANRVEPMGHPVSPQMGLFNGAKKGGRAMKGERRAVVLLSGGLDSATTAAIAKSEGFELYALSFRYGQRHALELESAKRLATLLGVVQHVTIDFNLRLFGGSALTGDIAVPKGRSLDEMGQGIPVTYVPARNTIFLSFALAWAETLSANDLFLGVNALDYSGYPDCRSEYIAAYQRMANLATKAGIEEGRSLVIHTPLLHLSKAQIICKGLELGLDYSLTTSCYEPTEQGACGFCDSCLLRLKGFRELGTRDPVKYVPASPVAR